MVTGGPMVVIMMQSDRARFTTNMFEGVLQPFKPLIGCLIHRKRIKTVEKAKVVAVLGGQN